MKKKKHNHHKKGHHRNANGGGGGGASSAAASRPRASRVRRAAAPPWKTILAAVGGGAGGAALGGLVVNQKILSPESVGLGLMIGGGATAYLTDGTARVVGTSVAAAGAGQLALAVMAKQALKSRSGGGDQAANQNQTTPQLASNQNALPAPPPAAEPPRRSANQGGVVVDLFRDAVTDLDMVDDEWRYGVRDQRDEPRDAAEPVVIELDEAA